MSTDPQPYRFTHEEYLTFERASTERHEYIDGILYALDGDQTPPLAPAGRLNRSRIRTNLLAFLWTHLRHSPLTVLGYDMRVRCGPYAPELRTGAYLYPDVLVAPAGTTYEAQQRDVVDDPVVLLEISPLAPDEGHDVPPRMHHLANRLPTLTDYLLVALERPLINHVRRTEAGVWTGQTTEGLDSTLHLERLAWTVGLADVYERVEFPAA